MVKVMGQVSSSLSDTVHSNLLLEVDRMQSTRAEKLSSSLSPPVWIVLTKICLPSKLSGNPTANDPEEDVLSLVSGACSGIIRLRDLTADSEEVAVSVVGTYSGVIRREGLALVLFISREGKCDSRGLVLMGLDVCLVLFMDGNCKEKTCEAFSAFFSGSLNLSIFSISAVMFSKSSFLTSRFRLIRLTTSSKCLLIVVPKQVLLTSVQ
mmetsp:Transcript_5717/g.8762  ORF Transcript_5717/g.8762 Transcript_5717/m.8762 type:complete len:209 (+) Transcript_5717:3077-3703(+)